MRATTSANAIRWFRLAPGFTSRVNLVFDVGLIAASVFTAYWLQAGEIARPARPLVWITTALTCAWIVAAAALRHYAMFAYERSLLDELAMIVAQSCAGITVVGLLDVLAPRGTPFPPIPTTLLFLVASTMAARVGIFRRTASREPPANEVLIVGTGPIGRLTAQDIRLRGRRRIVGHLSLADENDKERDLLARCYATSDASCEILGKASEIERVLRQIPVDEVFVAGNLRKNGEEMQEVVKACERFGVPFALPAYSLRLERAQAVDAQALADGYIHYQNTPPLHYQMGMKRLFDILSSAAALWLLMPLFLVVMALIKLSSRGPIFFKQERVGIYGRRFNMLKFRSMVVNAEALKAALARANEMTGPVFKMKHDPRITRIGRFIRKYSIDELPQLINVLRGDMSVVGPRPPVPQEVEKYEAWQRRRLSVRPGLTCIWQVSGRNQISFEEWMVLDMQYIDHWSLAQDMNLIFRTVPVVITGRGAS
jgi:exopolysaccharide biosynthesis polyprenyl glycosylphosphotransferase